MNPFLVVMPLLVVVAALLYGVFRSLGRIWLDHSIRLALLEKVEQKPQLLESLHELEEVLAGFPEGYRFPSRQDYRLTGVILAGIGLACTLGGRSLRVGTLAVGLYVGGLTCVGLGVALFLVGLLIRGLARAPVLKANKD